MPITNVEILLFELICRRICFYFSIYYRYSLSVFYFCDCCDACSCCVTLLVFVCSIEIVSLWVTWIPFVVSFKAVFPEEAPPPRRELLEGFVAPPLSVAPCFDDCNFLEFWSVVVAVIVVTRFLSARFPLKLVAYCDDYPYL